MLFSPFVLTGVVFLAGLLYLAHGMNMLPALQARALAAAEHIHAVSWVAMEAYRAHMVPCSL